MTFNAIPVARRQLPLHVHIATLFIALILVLGKVVIWNNYAETTRLMLRAADERFERIADKAARQLQRLSAPVAITVDLLAWQRLTFATLTERLDSPALSARSAGAIRASVRPVYRLLHNSRKDDDSRLPRNLRGT